MPGLSTPVHNTADPLYSAGDADRSACAFPADRATERHQLEQS